MSKNSGTGRTWVMKGRVHHVPRFGACVTEQVERERKRMSLVLDNVDFLWKRMQRVSLYATKTKEHTKLSLP